jgi:hypothetical protein
VFAQHVAGVLDMPNMRDETVYGPPLNTHCAGLDGPAVVRISNAT